MRGNIRNTVNDRVPHHGPHHGPLRGHRCADPVCSTTIVVISGFASNFRSFGRDPFIPDPTSDTSAMTGTPATDVQTR